MKEGNHTKLDQLDDRLEALNQKIGVRDEKEEAGTKKSDSANFANAFRLSSEFVVAILVGAGLGWAIDYYFGTSPWAMIALLPLGFVAGVLNVMRAAGVTTDPRAKVPQDASHAQHDKHETEDR